MEFIQNSTFVKKTGERISFEEAMGPAEVIGFYFSAHWCPPCRMFTPVLADMYNEVQDNGHPFQVVFVTSDKSEKDMLNYMNEAHGDWVALEFGSSAISDLKSRYNISGIPSLVIVKRDGTLISKDGRGAVQSLGPGAYQKWV